MRTLTMIVTLASSTAFGARAFAEPDAQAEPEYRELINDALAHEDTPVKLIGTRDSERSKAVGTGLLVIGAMQDQTWHRPGDRYRKAFWANVAGVGVGVLATMAAVSRVRSLEDDKLDLSRDFLDEADFDSSNVCAAAEGAASSTARTLVSVCASGRRWATISNGLMLGTALTAIAAGYLYYKGYHEPPKSPERFRVTPAVSTSSVSMGIALDF